MLGVKGLTTFSRSWSSEGKSSSTLFSHRNKLSCIALPDKKKNLNTQADLQDDGRSSLQQHQYLPSLVEENRNISSIFLFWKLFSSFNNSRLHISNRLLTSIKLFHFLRDVLHEGLATIRSLHEEEVQWWLLNRDFW